MTATIWPRDVDLVQEWFAIDEPVPGVFRIQEPLHEENVKSFLVLGTDRAALIDTGMGVADIAAVVRSLTDLPVTVINSHAHWDHIGGNELFDEIWIHEAEAEGLVNGVSNDILRPWFSPDRLRGPLPEGFRAEAVVERYGLRHQCDVEFAVQQKRRETLRHPFDDRHADPWFSHVEIVEEADEAQRTDRAHHSQPQ